MPKKTAGENTKKASGNAKKAEAAAQKAAQQDAQKAAAEADKWSTGAKSNAKKEDAEAKRQDQLRKKAEKEALLAAEESTQRATPKGANAKTAAKKSAAPAAPSRGLDLSQLDDPEPSSSSSAPALNATGIDSALDALDITSGTNIAVDRHPERRFKAAYAAYEARRMPELETEQKGLRRQQRIEVIRKEFEKSKENPFNQVTVGYDASKEDIRGVREGEKGKVEGRLAEKS